MNRSYELLIAEQLQKEGMMTELKDGVKHMTKGEYSSCMYDVNNTERATFVTVIFGRTSIAVFRIDYVSEDVELMYKSEGL